ncbi:8778_t:CDS:1, partial [Funneliformis geosporum]
EQLSLSRIYSEEILRLSTFPISINHNILKMSLKNTAGGSLTTRINRRRRSNNLRRKQDPIKPIKPPKHINNEETLNRIAQLSRQNTNDQIINDFFNGFSFYSA